MRKHKRNTAGCWSSILRPYYGRVLLLSLLSVIQSVIQVAMALLMRYVIDAAVSKSPALGMWIGLLVADLALQLVIHVMVSWYHSATTDQFAEALRSRLLKSAVYSKDVRLQGFHSGELLSRGMEDVHTVCDGVINALPSLIGQISRLIAAFAAVLHLYPGVAGVLALVAMAVLVVVAGMRPVLKARYRSVRIAEEQLMSAMQEDLQQLELIQGLGVKDEILRRFGDRQKVSLKEKCRRRIWSVSANSCMNLMSVLGTGLLLVWGAIQVSNQLLTYGALTAMLQLLSQFRSPVLSLSGLWTRFTAVEVAGERLAVLLETPEEVSAKTGITSPSAVVFENVTFSYPGEETPAIQNFSMVLPLEDWACITGISGRGKTTLFKLILGLYTPQQGRVYLQTAQGDIPCTEQTRHLFAYVPQDYALFSGTVLENLLLVAPDAQEDRRRQAMEIACAEFVWDMTQGENTPLGENNTGLSKGQLQRIAIARAILMERPVLLLDECTSALDGETEIQVLKNLKVLGKKAIVVTHRPDTLEQLDGITNISMEE